MGQAKAVQMRKAVQPEVMGVASMVSLQRVSLP
jgi:hypothetical protein